MHKIREMMNDSFPDVLKELEKEIEEACEGNMSDAKLRRLDMCFSILKNASKIKKNMEGTQRHNLGNMTTPGNM